MGFSAWTTGVCASISSASSSSLPRIAASSQSLLLDTDGTVYAWRENNAGQLGNGTLLRSPIPTQVQSPWGTGILSRIQSVSAAGSTSLALSTEGEVYAWGSNDVGQLGNGTTTDSSKPVQVKGEGGGGVLNGIRAISAGLNSLALKHDGTVYAWGDNGFGELGIGTTTSSTVPVQVKGMGGVWFLSGIKAVASGGFYSLALANDGSVYAWGYNSYGQLGNGTFTDSSVPVQVKGVGGVGILSGIKAIAAGSASALALSEDGKVYAWGHNGVGTLGNGSTTNSSVPVQVKGAGGAGVLSNIKAISADVHALALTNNGTVYAWGYNSSGELGDGTLTDSSVPVQVQGVGGTGVFSGIQSIAAGDQYSLALGNDGKLYEWGRIYNSQLDAWDSVRSPTIVIVPRCGDGKKAASEQCDDGHTTSGDGCADTCTVESGWTCTAVPDATSVCQKCNNGMKEGTEGCDDGNTADGDGCSQTCSIESDWACWGTQPSACYKCGNGKREYMEGCDDGNTAANDGCSPTCTVESNSRCTGSELSICQRCGNGVKEGTEECDDGNLLSNDGCSVCSIEINSTCTGSHPSVCQRCGNGKMEGTEQCDDNNVFTNDGCSNSCMIENHATCLLTQPSTCYVCGNGKKEGAEACDDGNTVSGDGCSATCQTEVLSSVSSSSSVSSIVSSSSAPSSSSVISSVSPVSSSSSTVSSVSPPSSSSSSRSSSSSQAPVCGDRLINAATEQCDDGNKVSGDGCSASCTIESGWQCVGIPSSCTPRCGDGLLIAAREPCDDGNGTNGDGCSALCQREQGWNCSGIPSVCQTLCGDSFKVGLEQCDDGNLIDHDGCSHLCVPDTVISSSSSAFSVLALSSSSTFSARALCGNQRLESGEQCEQGVAGCSSGQTCSGCQCVTLVSSRSMVVASVSSSSSSSLIARCNNGVMDLGEQCEVGIRCPDGSYCSLTCQCVSLVSVTASSVSSSGSSVSSESSLSSLSLSSSFSSSPIPVCGNGILNVGEECEINVFCSLGTCDSTCHCILPPSESSASSELSLSPAVCGNGAPETDEQCDDGNTVDGDGCSFSCQRETGYVCPGAPSTCFPVCGDGMQIPPEQCDDGNAVDGDGCSSVCEVEYAVALPACGNGMQEIGEQCDDGNANDNDGCSAICTIELLPASSVSSVSSPSSVSSVSFISSASFASSSSRLTLPLPTEQPPPAQSKAAPWLLIVIGIALVGLLFAGIYLTMLVIKMKRQEQ